MKNIKIPSVAVIMASYNGEQWLQQQVESILNQRDVNLTLYISDDVSTDETRTLIDEFIKRDSRVMLLPAKGKFGSASRNFYRLIMDVDISKYQYIAFADQDDIWFEDKLSKSISAAIAAGAEGVSSNVLAFWENGKESLIHKAQPQRKLDFLFESAGPGCTFVMSRWLLKQVRVVLTKAQGKIDLPSAHDWLVYTTCRALGKRWIILNEPTIKYRQHDDNELGAHVGYKASLRRLKKVRNGWYRAEVAKICKIALSLTNDSYVRDACEAILHEGALHQLIQVKFMSQYRRSVLERCLLGLAIMFNVY